VLHRLVGATGDGAAGAPDGGLVRAAAWAPDGSRLAVLGTQDGDPNTQVAVWDTKAGTRVSVFRPMKGTVVSSDWVVWDPKGERIAVELDAKSVKRVAVVDAATGKEGEPPAEGAGWWNPDDPALAKLYWKPSRHSTAVGRGNREVYPGVVDSWLAFQRGHTALSSPDGARVFWVPGEWTAEHPDAEEGRPLAPRVLDANTGRSLIQLENPGVALVSSNGGAAWSPDGTRIAAGAVDGRVVIWEAVTGKVLFRALRPFDNPVRAVAWSADGKRLALAAPSNATTNTQPVIALLSAVDGKERVRFPGPPLGVTSLAWSPDGTRLTAGSPDRTARVWTDAGREELILRGHATAVTGVCWHPDGNRIATAEESEGKPEQAAGGVRLWDATTGQLLLTLGGYAQVAWSPDGRRLAARLALRDHQSDAERDRHGNGRPVAVVWDAGRAGK
jgi:WD40 repeat protein